jgi:methionyl-tRNA formyltransferase
LIRVYTKQRHVSKIHEYLNSIGLEHKIFTIKDSPPLESFDLGVSYCYPRKITNPLLSTPKKGFVNYHPGPLPKYKGPTELDDAIKNEETSWGVTVHFMDKQYDTGPIIRIKEIPLHEPPTSTQELGAVSHYFLFELFKETIKELYEGKLKGNSQSEFQR